MDEDKQKICDLLLPALQATRGGSKVVALEYNPKDKDTGWETVTAVFQSGGVLSKDGIWKDCVSKNLTF